MFILSLEVLACYIRQNKKISRINIRGEVKLSLFADDISCFLKDNLSYDHLNSCLESKTIVSGLNIIKEKKQIFLV